MTSGKIEPLHTRFAKLVKVTAEGCWDWKGSFDRRGGYPLISLFGGQTSRGHRVSYMIFKGPIPAGMVVRHKCDNPRCTNPDHLILGSIRDNNYDLIESGKSRYPTTNSCLQIFLMQRWGMSIAAIAKVLRIDASCVSRICSGKMRIGLRQKFEQILKTQEEACQ